MVSDRPQPTRKMISVMIDLPAHQETIETVETVESMMQNSVLVINFFAWHLHVYLACVVVR